MRKPKFVRISGHDKCIPFTGLSMREIFNRFATTGELAVNVVSNGNILLDDPVQASEDGSDTFEVMQNLDSATPVSDPVKDDVVVDAPVQAPEKEVSDVKSE